MKCSSLIAWTSFVVTLFSLTTQAQKITTFDVPGGIDTTPMAISMSGQVTGFFGDPTTGRVRGFLRDADGNMTTFDVAGMNTVPSAINDAGQVAGYYCASSIPPCNSFLRQPDGTTSAIDIPDAFDAEATAIDARGQVTGHWIDGSNRHLAFLWGTDGRVKTFDLNGASVVEPNAMNTRGEIVGSWNDSIVARGRGFLRDTDGKLINLDVPAALTTDTTPFAINSKGQIAGIYSLQCPFPNTGNCSSSEHGFLREAHGSFATFDAPNSQFTVAVSLDAKGEVAGYYEDANGLIHGFLRRTKGAFLPFDVPNTQFTIPAAMTSMGRVTGVFADSGGQEHGFIASF